MIRRARKDESDTLTAISFGSKRYWNYPEEYYGTWQSELTITPEYLAGNDVWVYENDRQVIGYYALVLVEKEIQLSTVTLKKGHWLDHMFIVPAHIGQMVGTKLFLHLRCRCVERNLSRFDLLADPHARGFYEKMGCRYIEDVESTVVGRTTFHMCYLFRQKESTPLFCHA